jgi:UDP-N-acetylmuramyl pentapeptide phosphotransferase/UDP-N-acetylglucosamine-1-phosphate transferase
MYKLQKQDLIAITVGLIGSVLLWIDIDPGGWILYLAFLIFGVMRVSDFFSLNPYQRNKTQIVKFVFSLVMIITVVTHVIWGGQPLFGVLAVLVLVYSITNMETRERKLTEEKQ